MKRLVLMAAVATLAACGGSEAVVQVYDQPEGGQPAAIADLPVYALPYDRDAIFDSLQAAYGTPEPEVPADLSLLRDSIAVLNRQYSALNARWAEGYDSLRVLSAELEQIPRMNPRYLPLFNRFNSLQRQNNADKAASDAAFERFTSMQSRYTERAEQISLAREQWGNAAFADVDDVIAERVRELRAEPAVDTTDANGVARFSGLRSGDWWIHARYEIPYAELYWNVPIQVEEDMQFQLTRENAEVRPIL